MTQKERFDRLFEEKAAREAAGDSAKKQRKRELNAMAERLGITTKAGKKVFREGRAGLTDSGAVTERLAESLGIQQTRAQSLCRRPPGVGGGVNV
jgi:hypothetical protein